MLIRDYNYDDVQKINEIGKLLHDDYSFSLNKFSNCVVLETNKTIIGFAVYSIIYERAEIVDIIIEPSQRKQGYGLKLLSYVINLFKKRNCENVTLEVNMFNIPAVNLYNKLGFEIVSLRKNYYNGSDGYLMKKDLR